MNSYDKNEMRKVGAKVQSCADFALCAKPAEDYLFAQIKACAVHKAQSFALRRR
jgi:hypothetical protein